MKVSSNVLSMNALKEFVDSCLFIHDDVEPICEMKMAILYMTNLVLIHSF